MTSTAPSHEEQIRSVLARYCQHCDDGDFSSFATLFAESATFTVMGTTYEGREAIQAFMTTAQPVEARGKHLISQPVIDVVDDVAHVATDYAFVAREGRSLAITSTGRYVDRFEHGDDGWQIASRVIEFLGDP